MFEFLKSRKKKEGEISKIPDIIEKTVIKAGFLFLAGNPGVVVKTENISIMEPFTVHGEYLVKVYLAYNVRDYFSFTVRCDTRENALSMIEGITGVSLDGRD